MSFHVLIISSKMHFRINFIHHHNFSSLGDDNLASTPAALDVQTKDCCLNSVICASSPPYQNHPLWCH
jgi:hypothetical protein